VNEFPRFPTSHDLSIARLHWGVHGVDIMFGSLGPMFRRKKYIGWTAACFSVDWIHRTCVRIWLMDQIFNSCCCDKSRTLVTSEKSDKLNTDILKHTIGYTANDVSSGNQINYASLNPR
jgi:hypothetical protein